MSCSEEEAGTLLEVFTERRKHEAPGLALRHAFEVVYRARDASAGPAEQRRL